MANVDGPHGFKPVRTLNGSPILSKSYPVDASASTIGIGDLVVVESDGFVNLAAASPADGSVIGVAASPHVTGTAGYIDVWSSPDIVFEGQTDDGTGSGTSQAAVGANFNIIATASSNGISRMEIDESSAATTATLPIKVLGLHKEIGNSFGEFNKLEFIINNHALAGGSSGTGIN